MGSSLREGAIAALALACGGCALHVDRPSVVARGGIAKSIFGRRRRAADTGGQQERQLPVTVIGPGVVVDGAIASKRGGTLQVSRQAHIGTVSGIDVTWSDGAAPADA